MSAYLQLTTDYVFRGVSYTDRGPSIQAGADIRFVNGWFGGAWASSIDIGDRFGQQRDLEISIYGGYGRQLDDSWTLTGTVIAYRYPDTSGPFRYDYEELGVALNYDDRVWLEYAYSPDLYGTGYNTHNAEIYSEWRLPFGMTSSLGAGWYDLSKFTKTSGYAYWQAGLSRSFGRVGLDLRYHDTNRAVPLFSTPRRSAARVVLSARLQF